MNRISHSGGVAVADRNLQITGRPFATRGLASRAVFMMPAAGSSAKTPMTSGDFASASAFFGHSTNLAKLKRKPALSLYSRVDSIVAAGTADRLGRTNAKVSNAHHTFHLAGGWRP